MGESALHWAGDIDNHAGLAALLARHDDLTSINDRNSKGQTPIMFAVPVAADQPPGGY